jgi:glycosyltransferase involved in cell wall biosynthesis
MEAVVSEEVIIANTYNDLVVAVVIPCYRVRHQIESVLMRIGPEISLIYCIDDACPEGSGEIVEQVALHDSRIQLIYHPTNQGVGGAMVTGYRRAIEAGADIVVKLDGDGQMDPRQISRLIKPIRNGEADYVKGNRFFRLESLQSMPRLRVIGNAGLSFLTKLSTGYWNPFDPTNGFTAIHARVAQALPLDKLSRRYFFESDMLFRLNTLRAVILDVPMDAQYSDENSSLNLLQALFVFSWRHAVNTLKRIFYNYFLRNFNMASLHLVLGILLLTFGLVFGMQQWIRSAQLEQVASSGTVMLAALPVILGMQFLLNFIAFDMANVPRDPIHHRL